jgi:AcrR family transcriptional regulator
MKIVGFINIWRYYMNRITAIDKKGQIIHAARALFFRFGLAKTSMDDIAVACGLAKPTLYYYYENKEAIFNQIVEEEAQQFMKKLEKKLNNNLPPDENLKIFFRTLYRSLEHYAKELSQLPAVISANTPHGQPTMYRIREIITEKLKEIFERGLSQGSFRNFNNDQLPETVLAMTGFMNLGWIKEQPKKQRDRILETMLDVLLRGIKRSSK